MILKHFTMKAIILTLMLFTLSSTLFARSAFRVEGNNVIIDLDGFGVKSKLMVVELWSPGTIRVITTMNDQVSDVPCNLGVRTTEAIKFKAAYAQTNIEISTTKLLITIEEKGLIRLMSRDGRNMMIESDRSYDVSPSEEGAYQVTQGFFLNRRELVYGFGHSGKEARYNLRSKSFDIIQDEASIASPVMFSELGYAFIWNNYSATKFHDAPSGMTINSAVADEISYFFMFENNWPSLMAEIRNIFGKALMLPRWAYGFHLNPDAYQSPAELSSSVEKYNQLGIPVETSTSANELYREEKQLTAQKSSARFINSEAFRVLQGKYITLIDNSPDQRLVIPTHTNIPGIQRYGVFTVAGDITGNWETLKGQVSAGITSSFTGQPHWSTTIGGVKMNDALSPESKKELLTRWYQFAAFTPVFQGAVANNEIWSVGNSSDPCFKAISKSIALRYQLLPYIYSAAWSAVVENGAIMRSLLFDFQKDKNLINIDQQYLFGPSVMVCPVTAEGLKQMKVQLPENANWVDFWTGEKFTGGQGIETNVSLDRIPLYIKEGSVIPLATVNPDSLGLVGRPIEIRVYPGADGSFVLYEDENDGPGYKTSLFTKIAFDYSEKNKMLTIGALEGTYQGAPVERIFNVVVVTEDDGLGVSPAVNVQEVAYKGKRVRVKI